MSKNREKKHAANVAEKQAHVQHSAEVADQHAEHHLVEAPKGTSRWRFLFNLFLVVFLLLIFSVTGPMMSTLSGDGQSAGATYLSWTTPDGEKITMDRAEFYTEKRAFARLENLMPYLLLGQVDPSEDYQLARFLILEGLAERSGIYVANSEVADTILEAFGSVEVYQNYLRSQRELSASAYEEVLRRGLVVRRYLLITSSTASEVLPDAVIDRWKLGAEEFNFEYVEALAESELENARSVIIPDDELEDWFTALPAFQQRPFMSDRSLAADVAYYDPTIVAVDFSGLFERFPRPEDEDAEELANRYYNSFSHVRFAKPAPDPEDDAAMKALEENPDEARFFTFEEVADQARREAPVYYSMIDWLADIKRRQTEGEVIDLQTEAIALGLQFQRVPPRSRNAWLEGEEPWAGRYSFGSIDTIEGSYSSRVAVEEDGLVVTQVIEVREPELPVFPEIRDEVATKWAEERAPQLATEKLELIRDAFGERPEEGEFEVSATAEEFKAAVEAAGLAVEERGYDRQFPKSKGPDDKPTQAEFFIRAKSILFSLDEGVVIAAEATRDGQAAYLVRVAGKREGDVTSMTPQEAADITNQMRTTANSTYFASTFGDSNWVMENFNVYLASLEDDTEDDTEDA